QPARVAPVDLRVVAGPGRQVGLAEPTSPVQRRGQPHLGRSWRGQRRHQVVRQLGTLHHPVQRRGPPPPPPHPPPPPPPHPPHPRPGRGDRRRRVVAPPAPLVGARASRPPPRPPHANRGPTPGAHPPPRPAPPRPTQPPPTPAHPSIVAEPSQRPTARKLAFP